MGSNTKKVASGRAGKPRPSPLAYFSHSYRSEDRALNMFIWRLLSDRNCHFTVDPPEHGRRPMDITFLERMLRRSSCFVAAVPDRSKSEPYQSWSPYQAFEYRLAVRSGKPRLIFAEDQILPGPLLDLDKDFTLYFNRNDLDTDRARFSRKIGAFLKHVSPVPKGPFPPAAILRTRSPRPSYRKLLRCLAERFGPSEFQLEEIHLEDHHEFKLLPRFEKASVLVTEIRPEFTPPEILGLIHGRCLPCIRTCWVGPGEEAQALEAELGLSDSQASYELPARFPQLYRGFKIGDEMAPVFFWRDEEVEELAENVFRIVKDLHRREKDLEEINDATEYFLSLGGPPVFISNAAQLNHVGKPLAAAMKRNGINCFHYKDTELNKAAIPRGEDWKDHLEKKIREANLFVALISDAYWQSEECRDEFEVAVEHWDRRELRILIYEDGGSAKLPDFLRRMQIGRLNSLEIETIVDDVQKALGKSKTVLLERDDEIGRVAGLIEAVWSLEDGEDGAKVLEDHAELAPLEARQWVGDLAGEKVSARALLDGLIAKPPLETSGSATLGLLLSSLARLVEDDDDRRFLKDLIPRLRLFPNLNNLEVWRKWSQRREVGLAPADGKLERSVAPSDGGSTKSNGFIELVVQLAGENKKNWRTTVEKVGHELGAKLDGEIAARSRICIAIRESELTVPFEWLIPEGTSEPLGRRYPVRRLVTDARRENGALPLDAALAGGRIPPPRTLLIGYNHRRLRAVDDELRDLRSRFCERYEKLGWPPSLISAVPSAEATPERLERALRGDDYQIVHFSGHSGYDEDRPFLQLRPREAQDLVTGQVTGEKLEGWVRNADIRFFYLNCCLSALPPVDASSRSSTLLGHLLAAGVPEVISYFWAIDDDEARVLAGHFFEEYLRVFDAAEALRTARDKVSSRESIWAAPVLVNQGAFPAGRNGV